MGDRPQYTLVGSDYWRYNNPRNLVLVFPFPSSKAFPFRHFLSFLSFLFFFPSWSSPCTVKRVLAVKALRHLMVLTSPTPQAHPSFCLNLVSHSWLLPGMLVTDRASCLEALWIQWPGHSRVLWFSSASLHRFFTLFYFKCPHRAVVERLILTFTFYILFTSFILFSQNTPDFATHNSYNL